MLNPLPNRCHESNLHGSQLSHAATLPSLDVMRATALALLSSPSQRVYSMLNANQSDLLGALTRHAKPSDNNSEGSKD